jgi:hypothetical protein
MTNTADPWGPYRATIEDDLDTCADYLRGSAGPWPVRSPPDRHYIADKAHQLHTAACLPHGPYRPGHRRLAW